MNPGALDLQDKIKTALLAEALINRQPPAIRERLARSKSLGRTFGLTSYTVLGIAGIRLRQEDLLAAARGISTEYPVAELRVVGEGKATLKKREGMFLLEIRCGEAVAEAQMDVLGLMVEDRLCRIEAFGKLAEEIGPTLDLTDFEQTAQQRPLTDAETGAILNDLTSGVAAIQARLADDLRDGRARLKDLIPESLEYFEKLCGPDPADLLPDFYLRAVLPEYRRTLVQRDFRKGLEICLMGALRDDLCPAPWLGEIGNDRLWEALNRAQSELDPFSLLAALDLALYRQEDERFRSYAERAVGLLSADEFPRSDGVDAYRLIPALAKFMLNRIQLMEGGVLRQPFWKRMCAWMQAAVVARLMHNNGVDLDSLSVMVERHLLPAGAHANMVDLRREPMVEAGRISSFGFRREILGRLINLHARHQASGRAMPRIDDIRSALERLAPLGPPLSVMLPGPLGGYRRPREQGKELPEEYRERLREVSDDLLIGNLTNLSQHFALPEELRSALREVISKKTFVEMSPEASLSRLFSAGLVAVAERDGDLAQVIAAGILRIAPEIREEALLWAAVEALLLSAAAFEEEAVWADWLEKQLFELANRLPAGRISALLWQHAQELKKITRLELGIFRRAEAVASAGTSFFGEFGG